MTILDCTFFNSLGFKLFTRYLGHLIPLTLAGACDVTPAPSAGIIQGRNQLSSQNSADPVTNLASKSFRQSITCVCFIR